MDLRFPVTRCRLGSIFVFKARFLQLPLVARVMELIHVSFTFKIRANVVKFPMLSSSGCLNVGDTYFCQSRSGFDICIFNAKATFSGVQILLSTNILWTVVSTASSFHATSDAANASKAKLAVHQALSRNQDFFSPTRSSCDNVSE